MCESSRRRRRRLKVFLVKRRRFRRRLKPARDESVCRLRKCCGESPCAAFAALPRRAELIYPDIHQRSCCSRQKKLSVCSSLPKDYLVPLQRRKASGKGLLTGYEFLL